MNSHVKVSIITVAYNASETIEETIKSVINQSYPNIEYLILDGASSDDTPKIIESYSEQISYWHSKKDNGMYDAINKGIEKATGEIIAILNSDDVYAHKHVIKAVVERLLNDKSDAVYGDLQYVDRADLKQVKRNWKSGKYKEGSFYYGWMPPHPSFFVKKECYKKYGVFNTELKSAADYELMLRFIHKNKISLSYINEVLVYMREGGLSNQTLLSRLRGNREDKLAWKINQLKPKWFTIILKPLRKIRQFF